MTVLALAEKIAREVHEGHVEKYSGDPYVGHLARVADMVYGDDTTRAVAWLHDVVEDSPLTTVELGEAGIPREVLEAVDLVTHRKPESYMDYVKRIAESGNRHAIEVKIADLKDHLRPNCPERLVKKYTAALALLRRVTA